MRVLGGTLGMAFEASYYDEDVEQYLFVRPFVNGQPRDTIRVDPALDGSPFHTLPDLLCIERTALLRPCNRVQLFVSDDFQKIPRTNSSSDPEVDSVEWIVIGPAADSPGGSGNPEAQPSDCLNDGGV